MISEEHAFLINGKPKTFPGEVHIHATVDDILFRDVNSADVSFHFFILLFYPVLHFNTLNPAFISNSYRTIR